MKYFDVQYRRNLQQHPTAGLLAMTLGAWPGVLLALGLAVAGVAQASPPPDAISEGFQTASATATGGATGTSKKTTAKKPSVAQRLDALLAELPEADTQRQTERCINRRQIEQIRVLSSSLLLFEGRRNQFWINQFPHKCVGLRRDMVLAMEVRSSQLCAIDSLYGHDRFDGIGDLSFGGRGAARAHCVLAPFEAVSPEQASAIRVAAKNGAFR